MHYHQLSSTASCSLDMIKFNMIVDDSFCCLEEQMIVNDCYLVRSSAENVFRLKWQMRNCLKQLSKFFRMSCSSFLSFSGRL